ncbi:unnamed protein product [Malus baccata var. baccata]
MWMAKDRLMKIHRSSCHFLPHFLQLYPPMEPNLNLILLAFLHGAFIICILLLVISAALTCLLFIFALGLFSILLDDLYHIYLLSCFYFETVVEPNLELGFVVIVYKLLCHAVAIFLASNSFSECKVSRIKVKARRVMHFIDGLRPS